MTPAPSTTIVTETGIPLILEATLQGIQNTSLALYYKTDIIYIPRIDMAVSKDGGVTWSNYVARNLHQLGYRKNILHWEGLGQANDLCFKFRFWGTFRWVINNAVCQLRNI